VQRVPAQTRDTMEETERGLSVILTEVSSANEVEGSRTASCDSVKPVPVSVTAKRTVLV
jgi:hypothetical protein